MKKVLALVCALLLCTSLVVPALAEDTATLDFLWFSDGVEGDVMQAIINDYEAATPGVKINLVTVAFADMSTKVTNLIMGGTPPALIRTDTPTRFQEYSLDLNDAFGDADAFAANYYDAIKGYFIYNGRIICLPSDTTANGFIYNKTLFDKAGVKVPQTEEEIWTWDEFIAAVKEVQAKTDCAYGVVWDGNGHRYASMLYQWGGRIWNDDHSKTIINEPKSIDCLTYFVQQFQDGVFDQSTWLGGEDPNNLFRTGLAAVHVAGNWMISNYNDITNFEWGATYMPKQELRSTVPGGKYIMGFTGTGVEAQTKAFIQYLAQPEVSARYCTDSLQISPRKDQASLDWQKHALDLQIFSNELNASPAYAGSDFGNPMMANFYMDYHYALLDAIMGEKTPQQAMDDTAAAGDAIIAAK